MTTRYWLKEWLVACFAFAITLTAGFLLGQYDGMEHDVLFFAVMGSCYVGVSLAMLVYLRGRRHCSRPR